MPGKQADAFRDFGILPADIQPPPEIVRCFLTRGRILGQYLGTVLASAFGLGLALLLGYFLPFPLNVLGSLAALAGFAALVHLATHNDYRWIELDGQTLRAQQLYTGRIVERGLDEIECLGTMVYQIRSTQTLVVEYLRGRIKGIEVRFRDRRTPLRIVRADPAMTNAKELIEAIVYKMGKLREVDAEIVEFAGKPMVRHIFWKGERPRLAAGKNLKMCLLLFVMLSLMFGPILGFQARFADRIVKLRSVPPRQVDLQTLIEKGPQDNPHVQVTDFQFGEGYVVEMTNNRWTSLWIPLFPKKKPGKPTSVGREIKAVLKSSAIHDADALRPFLRQGQVVGICSDATSLPGGSTRTKLLEFNPGSQLSFAWVIEDVSDASNTETVQRIFWGASAFFTLVLVLAFVVFRLKN